jgi:hypothetical protein
MSKNPNDIKSQDDTRAEQDVRSTEVLIGAIEKCERLQKQLDIAVKCLKLYANELTWDDCESANGANQVVMDKGAFTDNGYLLAVNALEQIKELDK